MQEKDIVQALSLLSPEALTTVATVLEHRANSAVTHMNHISHRNDMSKAYAIFSNLADQARILADARLEEDRLEDEIEAESIRLLIASQS